MLFQKYGMWLFPIYTNWKDTLKIPQENCIYFWLDKTADQKKQNELFSYMGNIHTQTFNGEKSLIKTSSEIEIQI